MPVERRHEGGVGGRALKTDATVWCWGANGGGQLGDGTTGDANYRRLKPVQVVQGSGKLTGVKAISAGYRHTCALKTDAAAPSFELGNRQAQDPRLRLALDRYPH